MNLTSFSIDSMDLEDLWIKLLNETADAALKKNRVSAESGNHPSIHPSLHFKAILVFGY